MSKKMLINALHAEEARVAIVDDGHLVELDIEIAGSEQTRGNVYKGVVVRVEPGLQAAFVDIGHKKLGFLQMGEIHPENWHWRDDVPEEQRNRRPRIQEILRRGQELIVQVEKGERDNKGAALTTYISLPGRYMVLMPGSDSAGISRKVESESERKKLKELVASLEIPEGIGYIMRTEAVGRTKTELGKDLQYLVNLYNEIKEKGAEIKGAGLIYQESDLVIRTIRDYFTAEIDEVLVDSKDVYKQARAFFKQTMPKNEKLVKMHQEKRPIFSRFQLEEQIDLIYEKKVPLKSGGSIFIEPTEALVSIDVNSGKSTGEKGVEDTAFKTNLEAAAEAARQLRLRDLGGLIVIDFIDMRERKHNAEVEKALKAALKGDKARVTVGKISQFGLLEMSRQRIKQTLNQASSLECPHCEGRGKVKSVEAMALAFLRKVHAAAAKGTVAEVRGGLPLEVAYYLLNRKKRELAQIETDYDMEVTVKGKPSFLLNQIEVDLVKRERPFTEEIAPEVPQPEAGVPPLAAAAAEAPPAEEGKAKKKRRRKKKHHGEGEAVVVAEVAVPPLEEGAAEAAPVPAEIPGAIELGPEATLEEPKKKRRRRRRRGKGGAEAPATVEAAEGAEAPVAAEEPIEEHPAEAVATEEPHGEEGKKKRRRRRKRGGKAAPEAVAEGAMAEPLAEAAAPLPPQPEKPAEAPAAEKPKKPRAPRKKKPAAEVEAQAAPAPVEQAAPAPAEAPEKPAKAKRAPRPRKKAAEVAEAPQAEAVAEAEKPKRKRAPRKKKEETPAE
ncbi:Rne/Rng family ribonuclease [Geotalea sp. SG265]|uniref:Rne/Rng family ribonuclease n=1 Tax=Geotalea sp. SG265 TaxID=2922867 RepID=UPI001FAF1844|nr:Rne/Rng family ribonuclease [Geotalea sp. SG265]